MEGSRTSGKNENREGEKAGVMSWNVWIRSEKADVGVPGCRWAVARPDLETGRQASSYRQHHSKWRAITRTQPNRASIVSSTVSRKELPSFHSPEAGCCRYAPRVNKVVCVPEIRSAATLF